MDLNSHPVRELNAQYLALLVLHPDLEAEQAYIDHAYACLAAARKSASRLQHMVDVGRGGTEQARFEREVLFAPIIPRPPQPPLA